MSGRMGVVLIGVAVAAVLARGQSSPSGQQSFRATTDTVAVDVAVRRGGTMVTGLSAADFIVTDNGVKQKVESVEAAAVPIDVTLVVDVSGNHLGPWIEHPPPADNVTTMLDEEVAKVTALLRPDDRIRLFAIDTYTTEVFPLQAAASVRPVSRVTSGGMGAVFDTLLGAMLQPVEPNRRHVVIARTKGIDTISAIEAATLREVVRKSDVLLHLVMMERASDDQDEMRKFQCKNMGLCGPTKRFWQPYARISMGPPLGHLLTGTGRLLAESAEATGGAIHQTEALTEPSLPGIFRKAFEDFRGSYVLRYTPAGVKREGWHAISVTVPSQPKAELNWRRGYGIDQPAPADAAAARPGSAAVSAAASAPIDTAAQVVAAYGRGEYARVSDALRRLPDPAKLIRDFRAAGNPWPATPRREAALALELAEAGLFSQRDDARDEARQLLEAFTIFVRHPIEPDRFERHWLWAKLAILEGTLRPQALQPIVDAALERFPTEPRFVLARAIVTDQLWPIGTTALLPGQTVSVAPKDDHVASVTERYVAAMAFPETASEARVRLSWFLYRNGRYPEALARLAEVKDDGPADPQLKYVEQLFRGQVLAAMGNLEPAIAACRAALAVMPGAQSARVLLMQTLLRHGDRDASESLAEIVQVATPANDPWLQYWQADFRFYAPILARVREFAR